MKIYNPFKPHLVKINNEFYGVRKLSLFGCVYFYSDKLEAWNTKSALHLIKIHCYFLNYQKAQNILDQLNPHIKVL